MNKDPCPHCGAPPEKQRWVNLYGWWCSICKRYANVTP